MDVSPHQELGKLLEKATYLSTEALNARLLVVRPLAHGPLHIHDQAVLIALFKRARYVSDDVPYPTKELTIYRGELKPTRPELPGISWTLDRDVATKYAREYSTVGLTEVWQATAPGEAVLAQFTAEDEVVVDPGLLRGIMRVVTFPHFKRPI